MVQSTQSFASREWLCQLQHHKTPNLRENTLYTYKGFIEQYVREQIGQMRLASIRAGHIEAWQTTLRERLSPRTISCVRTMLSGVFKYAVKHRLISHNPVSEAEPPKWRRHEKYAFNQDEANAFMKASYDAKFGTCLRFMLETGVRPEEVMAARWQDLKLDGERGAFHVRKVILRIYGERKWRFEDPKTKNSVRTIGFPGLLITELKEQRKRNLEQKMAAGRHYQDHDLVFPAALGFPMTRSTLTDDFKATLKRAGLPSHIRLYDLRHSFVTMSLAAGVDVKTVSEEAGHASVAFTLDHYGHVLQSMRDSAVDKREAWLKAGSR